MNTLRFSRSAQGNYAAEFGFSMVEVLVAAFIIAIGLMGLTMLQAVTMKTDSGSGQMTRATRLAMSIAEAIQSEGRASTIFSKNSLNALPPTFSATKTFYFDKNGNTQSAKGVDTIYTGTAKPSTLYSASGGAGGMRSYVIEVSYDVAVDPANPSKLISRKVSFSRQVGNGTYVAP